MKKIKRHVLEDPEPEEFEGEEEECEEGQTTPKCVGST